MRTAIALSSDRALMHEGVRALSRRFAGSILFTSLGRSERIDLVIFDPTGDMRRDADELASIRRRQDRPAVAMLLGESTNDMVGPLAELCDAVIPIALAGEPLVRAICDIAETASDRPVDRGRPADWPGRHLGLTRRQSQIAILCTEGLSNAAIAAELSINIETVKTHLKSVFRSFGVHNRTQLVVEVLRLTGIA